MSKELEKNIKKIMKALESQQGKPTNEVVFSDISFINVYHEIENNSFVTDSGEFIIKRKFKHYIGAKVKSKAYCIINPLEIYKALAGLKNEFEAKRLIHYSTKVGYYETGEQITAGDLKSILEQSEVVTAPEYIKMLNKVDKLYNESK